MNGASGLPLPGRAENNEDDQRQHRNAEEDGAVDHVDDLAVAEGHSDRTRTVPRVAAQPRWTWWPYVLSAVAGVVLVAWVVFSLSSQSRRCSDRDGELRRDTYTAECHPDDR